MLHNPNMYNHNIACADPLHHSRNLLCHFLWNLSGPCGNTCTGWKFCQNEG